MLGPAREKRNGTLERGVASAWRLSFRVGADGGITFGALGSLVRCRP
jgi:hypothetical protein